MKIRNKKITMNKKIVTISLCALFLVIIGGISYAYFAAIVSGNEEAKDVQTYAGTMNLVYNGTFATSAEKMMPGDSHEIQFTVTNTGTLSTSYQVDMIDVINDFEKPEELVYSITSDNGGGQQEEIEVPITNETLIPAVGIDPGVTQNYTLKLEFKETGTDQNYNQNKTFSGKIQINSLENSNYLASRVLINQIKNDEVDYTISAPAKNYVNNITKNYSTSQSTTPSGLAYVASSYKIDENGYYELIDPVQVQFSEDSIGKYVCYSKTLTKNCSMLYKITEVELTPYEEPYYYKEDSNYVISSSDISDNIIVGQSFTFDAKNGKFLIENPLTMKLSDLTADYTNYYFIIENDYSWLYKITDINLDTKEITVFDYGIDAYYKEVFVENQTVSFTSDNNRVVGTGYTFDKETGTFTLTDTTENVTFSDAYIGYYTCTLNSQGTCASIHKIKELDGSTVILSDAIRRKRAYNYISKVDKYTTTINTNTNESGLYKAEDDFGTSYYYRGAVGNNYVSFANSLWRITRVNGDGSIRLIKNDKLTSMAFNSATEIDSKYLGYTYDNSAPNVQDGTSSPIKTYLDNWYNNNSYIKANKDKIVNGIYCNDTTSKTQEDGTVEYGSKSRIEEGIPSLKCLNTDKTYGGRYELSIGLLSADEAVMAGTNTPGTSKNYLHKSGTTLLMSPYSQNETELKTYYINYADLGAVKINTSTDVYPVINLNKDVKFTSGTGTSSSPFIVE